MYPPRLLVSVVDGREAAVALSAGAHVIDAKDPSRGALGAVGPKALAEIARACPDGTVISAALGDLSSVPDSLALPLERLSYVKIGLGGLRHSTARRALARLKKRGWLRLGPAETAKEPAPELILVGYADHARVCAPPPEAFPVLASEVGASGCLLDTAVKDGSCLLDWINTPRLRAFVEACRSRGLLCALAGSLRARHLPRVARLGPDLIGVRGAACDGDRVHGTVSGLRVRELVEVIAGLRAA
ncbi:MAG: (5-formylfuran-3-yl)methyl phosphate synthase [Acidobacteriota bacterium]